MNILLVDGTNLFLRNYAAVPALDVHGNPVGGVLGTLFSLRKIINDLKIIDKVIFVWDGQNGSKKRRSIVPEYKEGRKPIRLNRNYEFENENIEQNLLYQRIKIIEYLSDLPVHQVNIPDIEADDVIAYLCKYFDEDKKIIASSDKDFVQLLNSKTIIYNTSKKHLVIASNAHEEHGIHPNNFALARSMTGDKSDNLKGVGGVGFKTLIKLFPFFKEKDKISVDYFFDFCEKEPDKYKKFLDKKEFIQNNLKVMRLDNTLISYNSVDKILNSINNKVELNSTSFRVRLLQDGLNIADNYFQSFRNLQYKENIINE